MKTFDEDFCNIEVKQEREWYYNVVIEIYDRGSGDLIDTFSESSLRDFTACMIDTDVKNLMKGEQS